MTAVTCASSLVLSKKSIPFRFDKSVVKLLMDCWIADTFAAPLCKVLVAVSYV